jgi:hypothetical protein
MLEPVVTNLGMRIMTAEPISTKSYTNPPHKFVPVCVTACYRRYCCNKYTKTIEELFDTLRFCGLCRIEGKYEIGFFLNL